MVNLACKKIVIAAFIAACLAVSALSGQEKRSAEGGRSMFSIKKVFKSGDGINSSKITALEISDDYVFAGTDKGVAIFDKGGSKWSNIGWISKEGFNGFVKKLVFYEGKLWVLAGNSLKLYDVGQRKWASLKNIFGINIDEVNDIIISHGMIYLAGSSGLAAYNLESRKTKLYTMNDGLGNNNVVSIAVRGSFVFAGCAGSSVYRMNFDEKGFIEYPVEESSFSNIFMEFGSVSLWCGTNGKGVREFNISDESWHNYSMKNGLSDDFVQSMKVDGSVLWVGTFDGLDEFDINNKKWKVYSINEGLPDSSITAIDVDKNDVWVGTDNGLAMINKYRPEVNVEIQKNFLLAGDMEDVLCFECGIFDKLPIISMNASWSMGPFVEIWSTNDINLSKLDENGGCSIEWNITDIPSFNNVYFVKLQAINSLGFGNENIAMIKFDAVNPIITIDPIVMAPEEGLYEISGKYNKSDVKKIIINPGEITAKLNLYDYSYTAVVNLEPGINIIEAIIEDHMGRTSSELTEIYCEMEEPPLLTKRDESGIVPREDAAEWILSDDVSKNITSGNIFLSEMVLFYPCSVKIRENSYPFLENLIDILHKNNGLKIRIEGYAYMENVSDTPFKNNKELSAARALVVGNYLIKKGKISRKRMKLAGRSSEKVLVTPRNDSDKNVNRRVEIHLSK